MYLEKLNDSIHKNIFVGHFDFLKRKNMHFPQCLEKIWISKRSIDRLCFLIRMNIICFHIFIRLLRDFRMLPLCDEQLCGHRECVASDVLPVDGELSQIFRRGFVLLSDTAG